MKLAQVDYLGNVTNIIEISDADCLDDNSTPTESAAQTFCTKLFGTTYSFYETRDDGSIHGRKANIGGYYDHETQHFADTTPPGPWAHLTDTGEWIADWLVNIHTGLTLSHEELQWIGYSVRNRKEYRLLAPVLIDPADEFNSNSCIRTSYMYPTFETIQYGRNTIAETINHRIAGGYIEINAKFTMAKWLDLTPNALILATTFEMMDDMTNPIYHMHPQTAGRTPHELFRLIIEWAWAHTTLGNNEPAAISCHNVLRSVQMPIEVRNELMEHVPAQSVERYIRGLDPFVSTNYDIYEDQPMPPLFAAWINQTREFFTARIAPGEGPVKFNNEIIDITTLPESYPA